MFALAADGTELWRQKFPGGYPESPIGPSMVAGPASVVLYGATAARVFDAATGAQRYIAQIDGSHRVEPDLTGGLFTCGFGSGGGPVTVRHVDATGAQTWTATWRATSSGSSIMYCDAVSATQDGGALVAVYSEGPALDLGDRQVPGPDPGHNRYVIALDRGGAVQWTAAIGNEGIAGWTIAAAPDGGAVFGGDYAGAGTGLGLPSSVDQDAFVGRVDRSGHITAYAIGGAGAQYLFGIAAQPDGSANLVVQNTPDAGHAGVMRIGDRTLEDTDGQLYLLNLLP